MRPVGRHKRSVVGVGLGDAVTRRRERAARLSRPTSLVWALKLRCFNPLIIALFTREPCWNRMPEKSLVARRPA